MGWKTGLGRLRLVGTVTLALGVVLCVSVVLTRTLGYAPDDSFASLFAALWPTGLALAILGGLLWVAVWVLQGFVPAAAPEAEPPRRAHLNE
jgi:hypothetical protein